MQNISTDNADASTASQGKVATGRQLQVFKIYPLDSRPVAESQSWVSVVQVLNEVKKRILLRYRLHHRFISVTVALRLLNTADRKDLSEFLNVAAKQGVVITPALNTPQSNALVQAKQDTVRDTVNRIIQQNIINNLRQQHLRQQRPLLTAPQFNHGAADSEAYAEAPSNEVLTATPIAAQTKNAIYSSLDHHHAYYAAADSEIAVEALINSASLRCAGSIIVVGTERFRRLAWLHAAALGMYIEGYAHTETDRQALFMRTDTSAHANIRPCYMPAKAFQQTVIKAITSKAPMMDLSAAEREYLLQRVRQNVAESSQQHQAEAST